MTESQIEFRDVGDQGRSPAPEWFLRNLAERAAELLTDVDADGDSDEWDERRDRWREVWQAVQANG